MRKPQGYWICTDPDPASWQPREVERDTVTCLHCGRVDRVKPKPAGYSDKGGSGVRLGQRLDGIEEVYHCTKCGEYKCDGCRRRGDDCWPLDMALEIMEAPREKLLAKVRADQDRAVFLRQVFGAELP